MLKLFKYLLNNYKIMGLEGGPEIYENPEGGKIVMYDTPVSAEEMAELLFGPKEELNSDAQQQVEKQMDDIAATMNEALNEMREGREHIHSESRQQRLNLFNEVVEGMEAYEVSSNMREAMKKNIYTSEIDKKTIHTSEIDNKRGTMRKTISRSN